MRILSPVTYLKKHDCNMLEIEIEVVTINIFHTDTGVTSADV